MIGKNSRYYEGLAGVNEVCTREGFEHPYTLCAGVVASQNDIVLITNIYYEILDKNVVIIYKWVNSDL